VRVVRHGLAERVERVEQPASLALAVVGDAFCDDPFDGEDALVGVAAGGEGFVFRPEKACFGESALRAGQYDIGRDQAFVAALVSFES